ncbi:MULTISPECIES: lipopolysaccharide assembly protein LapB [Gammaproteobacteria]|uniref:tetratricopeptide repeat protein n=1 Tax=Gammaproteobacteria TaxID=1236 RepID=UPI000DD0582F|nr:MULTISPECIES: hypothetical protein [Gammaproteobacteria]RTE85588.1 hypothetical protein DQX04_11855 [Aliidiomarina sp. B3213]TCZ89558.1 hypothetical protein EYQ95_11785 [Lysobacter sp. N42]
MKFISRIKNGLLIALIVCSTQLNAEEQHVNSLVENIEIHFPDRLNQAQQFMEQALDIAPNHAQVNYYCGVIYGIRASEGIMKAMRFAGKSRRCLENAVTLEPRNLTYRLALFNYYLSAPSIVGGGEEAAKQEMRNIQELDEVQGAVAHLRIVREFDTERYSEELHKMAEQYPQATNIQLRLGLNLQEHGEYELAHESFVRITSQGFEHDDTYFNALYQIGRNAVFSHQRVSQGIEAMERYITDYNSELEIPDLPWAYARMAQLQSLENNADLVTHYKNLALENSANNDRELHDLMAQL